MQKQIIHSTIDAIHELIKICYPRFTFSISYLTIFSQSENDFQTLRLSMQQLGQESEANNGYKYTLHSPIAYLGEKIQLIRVRKPDVHRKELGCGDLVYKRDDYNELRNIAIEKGYDIIVRKSYEMIELSTFEINVYAYLVKEIN